MGTYIIRRLLFSLIILFGVSILTFTITRVVPSSPAHMWAGPHPTAEQVAKARVELGLDEPLYVQYYRYTTSFLQGNWGKSLRTHDLVLRDIASRLPASLELIFSGMFIAIIVGIPLGIISAAKTGKLSDHVSRVFSIAGVAVPTFWLGMILQLIFFKQLGVLPIAGRVDSILILTYPIEHITGFYLIDSLISGNLAVFADVLKHMILPALTLSAYPLGLSARMTRATMLEVLNEDYIRTARASGIRETKVMLKHALRNSIRPIITVLVLTFAYSLIETFLIEAVFSWPGLGHYAAKAIITVDYPAIMAITVLIAFTYCILNLGVDIAVAFLDPRISIG